jgi:hypothetical protein
MNSFTYIISSFFPSIDIFKISQLSMDNNNLNNVDDLVKYGYIYTLHSKRIKED